MKTSHLRCRKESCPVEVCLKIRKCGANSGTPQHQLTGGKVHISDSFEGTYPKKTGHRGRGKSPKKRNGAKKMHDPARQKKIEKRLASLATSPLKAKEEVSGPKMSGNGTSLKTTHQKKCRPKLPGAEKRKCKEGQEKKKNLPSERRALQKDRKSVLL